MSDNLKKFPVINGGGGEMSEQERRLEVLKIAADLAPQLLQKDHFINQNDPDWVRELGMKANMVLAFAEFLDGHIVDGFDAAKNRQDEGKKK